MPAKNQPTVDDKRRRIRQEGRIGVLYMTKDQYDSDLLKLIDFQVFMIDLQSDHRVVVSGYCELFEPTAHTDHIPSYSVRVDRSEPEPIIEMFKQKG